MILKQDETINATSLENEVTEAVAPVLNSTTSSNERKGKPGASRGAGNSTGVSMGWKIASPILAVAVFGTLLAGGHYLANYLVVDGESNIKDAIIGNLEDGNKDLADQLDEAKKPTTVVFDENQITQVSSALIANKGIPGKITNLRAQHFDVETNILTLYFDGIEGGKEVVFSTQVKFKDGKFTSEDAKLALEEQKPMCQIYKSVEEFKLNAGVYDAVKKTSLDKISSTMGDTSTETVTIDDIKMEITISRNAARGTAKVSYKALLVDGEKMTIVDEGFVTVDYDTTEAEANSIVIQNFVNTYGSQASAVMFEEDEM